MDPVHLLNLQLAFFFLIFLGRELYRRGLITEAGKSCLSDLCIKVILPFNIVKSSLMPFQGNVFATFGKILLCGALLQLLFIVLNHFMFNKFPAARRKIWQYGTVVCNSGFIGNPVAEGIYGPLGLLYASIFLIPLRFCMWSVGIGYFMENQGSKKDLLKKVLTHPCLVAVYIGTFLLVTQLRLPEFLNITIKYIGNCNSAITMLLVGTILADVPLKTIFTRGSFLYSGWRLLLLPAIAFGIARLLQLDPVAAGVAVLMTGMPAGATTPIFADKYGCDAPFATKITVLSTLLSMGTILLWGMVLPSP